MSARSAVLAIETSGRVGGVGAYRFRDDDMPAALSERTFERGLLHGAALTPSIREILRESGLAGPDLALVCVSGGPGSWTGLRIGVTAAKALAYAWKVPVAGVSSLEALALEAWARLKGEAAPSGPIVLAPIRDAKRDEAFVGVFVSGSPGQGVVRTFADSVVPIAELPRVVPAGAFVFGDAKSLAGKRDLAHLLPDARLLDGPSDAGPAQVARLGWRALAAGDVLDSPERIHALAPRYLKLSHPELKLRERTGEQKS